MTPPTPQELAHRLTLSADLLGVLAYAIRANLADELDTPAKSRLIATCKELDQISCVHRQTAVHFKNRSKKSSKQPLSAAKGTTPEAVFHA